MTPQPRLLDRVRERLRLKHYSIRTEQAYVDWIIERAKRPARVPVVLTEAEVRPVLAQKDGRHTSWRGSSTVLGSGSWSAWGQASLAPLAPLILDARAMPRDQLRAIEPPDFQCQ